MAISALVKPGPLCWTGNSIHYTFFFGLLPVNSRLQVQLLNSSGVVVTEVLYPLNPLTGVLFLPLHELIHPQTAYLRPSRLVIAGTSSQATEENSNGMADFTIRWRTVYTGSNTTYTQEAQFRAIRGGIGDMTFTGELPVNQYTGTPAASFLPRGSNWLTWVPDGRLMRPEEFGWLLLLCTIAAPHFIRYLVNYLDGTTATINRQLDTVNTNFLNRKFYVPVGITQAGLDPVGKGVASYAVQMVNAFDTQSYVINVDNLPRYNSLTLYYRNSVGGWDNIAINGNIERSADVERAEYEASRNNISNPATNGTNNNYTSSFRPKWKGVTGYLSKAHCAALLDLLNSTECALLNNGKWLPVKMTTKTLSYLNTNDSLHSIALEFEAAGSFDSFPSQLLNFL